MTNNDKKFNVGQAKLYQWTNFVLGEGFLQSGGVVHKQSSVIFIGTAPAPDLGNDFAFMHEIDSLNVVTNRYLRDTRNSTKPLYPLEFIEQYGSNTLRDAHIYDTVTVAPGLPNRKGPTFKQIIKREGREAGGGGIWWNVSGIHSR